MLLTSSVKTGKGTLRSELAFPACSLKDHESATSAQYQQPVSERLPRRCPLSPLPWRGHRTHVCWSPKHSNNVSRHGSKRRSAGFRNESFPLLVTFRAPSSQQASGPVAGVVSALGRRAKPVIETRRIQRHEPHKYSHRQVVLRLCPLRTFRPLHALSPCRHHLLGTETPCSSARSKLSRRRTPRGPTVTPNEK